MAAVNNALIVGAGIGGLGASIALAKQGIDVDVVEIREDSEVFGVGINQPGNSLRALRDLGVLDEIRAAGFEFDSYIFHDEQGNIALDHVVAVGGEGVPNNVALTRRDLHDTLIAGSEKQGVRVRYGVSPAGIADKGDKVEVEFSDGSSGTYDVVVGFDGIHSPLRRQLFGDSHEPTYTGYAVWRVTVPRPPEASQCALFQGVNAKAGYIPLNDKEMYLLVVTPEPEGERYEPNQMVELLRERLKGFGSTPGQVRDDLKPGDTIVFSPLSEVMLPTPWHKGRIVVAGDAAHACTPHITQGAGMALEDAIVLAQELAADRPIEEALTAFEERRYPRAKFVQDVSRGVLEGEMRVTSPEAIGHAMEYTRTQLDGQMDHVDKFLRQPA